jgi:serine/threonine-protein kinase
MPSLTCQVCEHENDGSSLFCHSCGHPLTEGDAADNLIGKEILGTYRLVQLLGKGGMSVVYRAHHVLTDQEVAVKVLPPELSNQREVKARFIEEARTLARLEHPNIVTLHNFVEADGYLYLVMQCADGETFDEVIEREGRVEVGEAVRVTIEVLRALEYAHEQGVVHRDIKPSNIIIRGDGGVKVMDFGIAKIMGSSKLTQTGQTMGTVRYMSPEQVRGKQVDHRSDLYSLGIALYEAVAGRTPFDGENHFEIMQKQLSATPTPPGQIVPIAPELEAVVLKAISKPVDQRYQSARDFRHALQSVPVEWERRRGTRSSPLIQVTPELEKQLRPPRRRRRMLPMLIASVLLLLSAAVVVWAVIDPGEPTRGKGPEPKTPVREPTAEPAWPQPHHAARGLAYKVDRTIAAPIRLRVMAVSAVDVEALKGLYQRALATYPRFLKDEGMSLDVKVGPLNLAVVSASVLSSMKAEGVLYSAPSATLFVQDGKDYMKSDLPYGFALHFCARIAQLSNRRCQELAEGFDLYLRKQQP